MLPTFLEPNYCGIIKRKLLIFKYLLSTLGYLIVHDVLKYYTYRFIEKNPGVNRGIHYLNVVHCLTHGIILGSGHQAGKMADHL